MPIGVEAALVELGVPATFDFLRMYDFCDESMVWIKDRHGVYHWANQPLLLNFTLDSLERVIGKTDFDLVPVYLAELYQNDDRMVLQGEAIMARVEPVTGFRGIPKWFSTWKIPLRNAEQRIVGTMGMTRPLPAEDSPEFPLPELLPALQYMQQHLARDCNNQHLADLCEMAVRTFERKFKSYFQISPTQFLNRMRVTRAAQKMLSTQKSLGEVAEEFGFSDQSHLTREFRKHFGCTPKSYRARHYAPAG